MHKLISDASTLRSHFQTDVSEAIVQKSTVDSAKQLGDYNRYCNFPIPIYTPRHNRVSQTSSSGTVNQEREQASNVGAPAPDWRKRQV